MPLTFCSYQKILPPKFLFEFGGLFAFRKTISWKKGQSPEYVFALIKIFESGMALKSILQNRDEWTVFF